MKNIGSNFKCQEKYCGVDQMSRKLAVFSHAPQLYMTSPKLCLILKTVYLIAVFRLSSRLLGGQGLPQHCFYAVNEAGIAQWPAGAFIEANGLTILFVQTDGEKIPASLALAPEACQPSIAGRVNY